MRDCYNDNSINVNTNLFSNDNNVNNATADEVSNKND